VKKKSRAPEMHRLASLDQSGDRQSICFCRLIDVEVAIACSCSPRLRLQCSFFGTPCAIVAFGSGNGGRVLFP